jgi:hypothetical protein
MDMVPIGADQVIDTKEDFTKSGPHMTDFAANGYHPF